MRLTLLLLSLATLCLFSCKDEENSTENILAKTDHHTLYKDDVLESLPISLSEEDSIAYIKSYVEDWLHFTLLYERAEDNVRDNDSSLAKQVERFKKELYINTYEQLFLQQKLDTLIPQKEIDAYYDTHKSEYIIDRTVVKPILIVFPLKQEEHIKNVEKLFFSKKDIDADNLKDYCFMHCQKFSFADTWIDLEALKQELPFDEKKDKLSVGKPISLTDTANIYFVSITDQLQSGSRMPVELAHDKIAKIILQKRKITLLQNMRNKVYKDAQYKKQFEVYY